MYQVDTTTEWQQQYGATGIAEILQNVRNILSTTKGTVPLDRTFGIRQTFLDRPQAEAMALFTGEVIAEVEKQEPRVRVLRVEFKPRTNDAPETVDGRLYPVVTLEIKEAA